MKTILKNLMVLVTGLVIFTGASAQANNDNALIGKAHTAVGACLGQQRDHVHGPIQSEVYTTSICFVSGETKSVHFYYIVYGPPCIPTEEDPCHPALPILFTLATVDFDCDGNIIGSWCRE